MIETTFELNGEDWSEKVSTLSFRKVYPVAKEIRTINGDVYIFSGQHKWAIDVKFVPLSENEYVRLNNKFTGVVTSVNSKPIGMNSTYVSNYKLATDLTGAYALKSIDGKVYYTDIALTLEEM